MDAVATTKAQREIIEHSLGLNWKKEPYRNHYCTADGDPRLEALVTLGLMKHGCTLNDGRDRYYHVTAEGAAHIGKELPK